MSETVILKKYRSTIGCDKRTLKIMAALGFNPKCHIGKKVEHKLNPCINGMINLVRHLVVVDKI